MVGAAATEADEADAAVCDDAESDDLLAKVRRCNDCDGAAVAVAVRVCRCDRCK